MFQYRGFLVRQTERTNLRFINLIAPAKEVIRWAHADSIEIDRGGFQRSLTESRWKQIAKFFNSDVNNVIPSGIIIAFDPEVIGVDELADLDQGGKQFHVDTIDSGGLVQVSFGGGVRESSYIIDGQHRLKGMSVLSFDVHVPVSLFLEMPPLERAFQFITINNKSHKVPTNNIKALIANFDAIEADLKERLTTASITAGQFATIIDVFNEDKESPFHKCVDWVNNRYEGTPRLIAPQAIENSVKSLDKAFREYLKEDDQDTIITMMAVIWKTIKNQYEITINNIGEYRNLFKKPTIQAITEHVADAINQRVINSADPVDITDADFIADVTRGFMAKIPEDFWTAEWLLKGLDTHAGRRIILNDIASIKKAMNLGQGAAAGDWKAKLQLYRIDEENEPE
jgi:DGQHR domain-containing protein